MMINRRSFLHLIRNRIAAGVLCSGMLTDALERGAFPLVEVFPSRVGVITKGNFAELLKLGLASAFRAQYENIPGVYGVGIAQQMDEFSRQVAETARQKMEEQSGL